jgi:hypothetical protein
MSPAAHGTGRSLSRPPTRAEKSCKTFGRALLAAAADPARLKSFRIGFIELVKKMDPLDAAVLRAARDREGDITKDVRNEIATEVSSSPDEVDVSLTNLEKLDLVRPTHRPAVVVSPVGREFLRLVSG